MRQEVQTPLHDDVRTKTSDTPPSATKTNNRVYGFRYIADSLGSSIYDDRFDDDRQVVEGEKKSI